MLTGRYGRDVEIRVTCCEIRVAESDPGPTRCPAVLWQEQGANFLIIKTGDSAFRGQYFRTPKQQHIAGRDSYANLQDCVAALLDAPAHGLHSAPAAPAAGR